MEKMVLLFWAMCLFGGYVAHLRLNNLSLSSIRLHPEMYFLPALLPPFTAENLKKVIAALIHFTIPSFIFHLKNTSKIFFSPDFEPVASGG